VNTVEKIFHFPPIKAKRRKLTRDDESKKAGAVKSQITHFYLMTSYMNFLKLKKQ
jgi:hypothetical protein